MVNQIDEAVRARVWPGIGSEAIQQLNHYYQRAGETGAYYGGYYNGAYRTLYNNGTYYNFHSSITTYEEFGDLYSRETAGKTWQMVNQIDEAVRARVWPGIGSEAIQQLNHYYQTHMSEANRRDFDETAVAHMRAGETGAYYGGYYNGAYRTL